MSKIENKIEEQAVKTPALKTEGQAVESEQPVQHEATLFAEPIAHLGNFPITNSLIMSWLTVLILVVALVAVNKKKKAVPRGIQNVFELLLEQALNLGDTITGERKKTERFLPIVLTLFLFILISNWLGLLPGVGTIGFIEGEGAHRVFVPFLRGGTADLNTTLAFALFAVVMSHIFGVISVGAWRQLNKYINFKTLGHMIQHIKHEPLNLIVSPIKVFVGLVELVGEIAKVASLSFRLFGNIFAGEVLLASMMAIFAYVLPLPFIFLEIFVGIIQAFIFSVLAFAFMSIAVTADEH